MKNKLIILFVITAIISSFGIAESWYDPEMQIERWDQYDEEIIAFDVDSNIGLYAVGQDNNVIEIQDEVGYVMDFDFNEYSENSDEDIQQIRFNPEDPEEIIVTTYNSMIYKFELDLDQEIVDNVMQENLPESNPDEVVVDLDSVFLAYEDEDLVRKLSIFDFSTRYVFDEFANEEISSPSMIYVKDTVDVTDVFIGDYSSIYIIEDEVNDYNELNEYDPENPLGSGNFNDINFIEDNYIVTGSWEESYIEFGSYERTDSSYEFDPKKQDDSTTDEYTDIITDPDKPSNGGLIWVKDYFRHLNEYHISSLTDEALDGYIRTDTTSNIIEFDQGKLIAGRSDEYSNRIEVYSFEYSLIDPTYFVQWVNVFPSENEVELVAEISDFDPEEESYSNWEFHLREEGEEEWEVIAEESGYQMTEDPEIVSHIETDVEQDITYETRFKADEGDGSTPYAYTDIETFELVDEDKEEDPSIEIVNWDEGSEYIEFDFELFYNDFPEDENLVVQVDYKQEGEDWVLGEEKTVSEDGIYTIKQEGLESNSNYDLYLFSSYNDYGDLDGYTESNEISFSTLFAEANVETANVYPSIYSAEFVGEVTDLGDYEEVYAGFEYREEGEEWIQTESKQIDEEEIYSINQDNLDSETEYEVKAGIYEDELMDEKIDEGISMEFETDEEDPDEEDPSIEISEIKDITNISATIEYELYSGNFSDENIGVVLHFEDEEREDHIEEYYIENPGTTIVDEYLIEDLNPETEYTVYLEIFYNAETDESDSVTFTTYTEDLEEPITGILGFFVAGFEELFNVSQNRAKMMFSLFVTILFSSIFSYLLKNGVAFIWSFNAGLWFFAIAGYLPYTVFIINALIGAIVTGFLTRSLFDWDG